MAASHALSELQIQIERTLQQQLASIQQQALRIEALTYERDRARLAWHQAHQQLEQGVVGPQDAEQLERIAEGAQLELDAAIVDYHYQVSLLLQAPGELVR